MEGRCRAASSGRMPSPGLSREVPLGLGALTAVQKASDLVCCGERGSGWCGAGRSVLASET